MQTTMYEHSFTLIFLDCPDFLNCKRIVGFGCFCTELQIHLICKGIMKNEGMQFWGLKSEIYGLIWFVLDKMVGIFLLLVLLVD